MSSPTDRSRRSPNARTTPRTATAPQPTRAPQPAPDEPIDPVWLAKALGLTILAALVCAWLAVCLLYYQGEWQLILHPDHAVDINPAFKGLAFDTVRFDAAQTGQPRLTAWYVPAAPGAEYASLTVLYLHGGTGSLANTMQALARLHSAGLNVFAIDYRGFGQSDPGTHPTEARMAEDTRAALTWLTEVRHLPVGTIVPYGSGLGAALAVRLAHGHPELPGVILDDPDPDPTATAVGSRSDHIVPIRLLFRERFNIAAPLASLTTPKLLLVGAADRLPDGGSIQAIEDLYRHAASPAITVVLPATNFDQNQQDAMRRFLDQYVAGASAGAAISPAH